MADKRCQDPGADTLSDPRQDFFTGIPECREAFNRVAMEKVLPKNSFLYMEGDVKHSAYYLTEGWTVVSRLSTSGKKFVLYVHKPGWLTFAADGYQPRIANCQALTSCRVLEVGAPDFKNLLARFPEMNQKMLDRAYNIVCFMSNLYISAFTEDAEIRLKRFMARTFCDRLSNDEVDESAYSIHINMSQDNIAAGAGISRAMASKLLHKMTGEGILSIRRRKIFLIHPFQLLRHIEM